MFNSPQNQIVLNQSDLPGFFASLKEVASYSDSVTFRNVTFSNQDIPAIRFLGFLNFEGCTFSGTLRFLGSVIQGGLSIYGGELLGNIVLRHCRLDSDFIVDGLIPNGSNPCDSDGSLRIESCYFAGGLSVNNSTFGELVVPDIRVEGNIEVRATTVHRNASFARANVAGGIRLSQPVGTMEVVSFGALDLQSVRVQGNLSLRGIQVTGRLDMHDAEVGGSVHFKPYQENLEQNPTGCRANVGQLHGPGLRANHALDLRGLTVHGKVILTDASVMAIHAGASIFPSHKGGSDGPVIRLHVEGGFHLTSANVTTDVDLSGARLEMGLYGANMTVGGAFKLQYRRKSRTYLGTNILQNNDQTRYSVWLVDSRIGSYLSIAGAKAFAGICLDGITVHGDLFFDSIREPQQPTVHRHVAAGLPLRIYSDSVHPHGHKVRTIGNSGKQASPYFAISMRDASIDGDIHISGLTSRTTQEASRQSHSTLYSTRDAFDEHTQRPEFDITGSSFRNLYADRDCRVREDNPVAGYATINLRLQNITALGSVFLPCFRAGYVYLDQAKVDGSVVFYNQLLDPISVENERHISAEVRQESVKDKDNSTLQSPAAIYVETVKRLIQEFGSKPHNSVGISLGHLSLRLAHVRGDIDLSARTLIKGLDAEQVQVDGDIFLFGTELRRFSVDYQGSDFSLSLFQATITGSLEARGIQAEGGIDLAAATIRGNVDFSTAQRRCMLASRIGITHVSKITWPVTCCLWMRAAQVGGKLLLQGAELLGGLSLIDASIGGVVDLSSSYRMEDPKNDKTDALQSDEVLLFRPTRIGSSKYRPDEGDFSIDLRNAKLANFLRADNSKLDSVNSRLVNDPPPPSDKSDEYWRALQLRGRSLNCGPVLDDFKKVLHSNSEVLVVKRIIEGFCPPDGKFNDSLSSEPGGIPLYTKISRDINLSGVELGGIHLKGVIFGGNLRARQMKCSGGLDFLHIYGQKYYVPDIGREDIDGRQMLKKPQLDFSFSIIGGKVELAESFICGIQAVGTTIKGVFNTSTCYVHKARRRDYEFSMRLTGSDINGHCRVRKSVLAGGIALVTAKIRADFHCNESLVAAGTWQTDGGHVALIGHRALIGATTILTGSKFEGVVDLSNAEIGKDLLAHIDRGSFVPTGSESDDGGPISQIASRTDPVPLPQARPIFELTGVKIRLYEKLSGLS